MFRGHRGPQPTVGSEEEVSLLRSCRAWTIDVSESIGRDREL